MTLQTYLLCGVVVALCEMVSDGVSFMALFIAVISLNYLLFMSRKLLCKAVPRAAEYALLALTITTFFTVGHSP